MIERKREREEPNETMVTNYYKGDALKRKREKEIEREKERDV